MVQVQTLAFLSDEQEDCQGPSQVEAVAGRAAAVRGRRLKSPRDEQHHLAWWEFAAFESR